MVILVPPMLIPLSSQKRYLPKRVPSKRSRDRVRAIKIIGNKKCRTLKGLDLALIFTPYYYVIFC
jgi:hypothetical protein